MKETKQAKCKHEWRHTTNNYGGTDGVFCIHCLEFREWKERFKGEK